MTQMEEVSMTFQSKTTANQMNGHSMTGTARRDPEESLSTSTSPSGRDGTSGGSVLEMGSTDSAESTHAGGPSCGLVSSLFPSTCRGRAEAFARRLHRRLTSLGGENGSQDDLDSSKPSETSWLHSSGIQNGTGAINSSNNVKHVLDHQPRHTPESDMFYDLDADLEEENGLDSPDEEASAAELAHLLVNTQSLKIKRHESNHCSPEKPRLSAISLDSGSGGIYSSPISGNTTESDEFEKYFDPLSSDGEKKKKDIFFDPVTTSDGEDVSALSSESDKKIIRVLLRKLDLSKNEDQTNNHESSNSQENSDSSCSLQKDKHETPRPQFDIVGSTDESSNGKSSLDTTSHESLWSTFDDSTLSESPVRNDIFNIAQIRVHKSHSDSELPVKGSRLDGKNNELVRRIEEYKENIDLGVDEVDLSRCSSEMIEKTQNLRNDEINTCYENGVDHAVRGKDDKEDEISKVDASEEPSDTDTDQSTYNSTITMKGILTGCVSEKRVQEFCETKKDAVKLLINDDSCPNEKKKYENTTQLSSELDVTPDLEQQDENCRTALDASVEDNRGEEEDPRLPRVRRCSSLKTGKTPPGTPGRKKIVRFADVLGLDLADVRTFLDEIPKVPNSAYSDLIYDDVVFSKDHIPVNLGVQSWSARYMNNNGTISPLQKPDRTLVPLFQQPGGLPSFLDFVRVRRVCLENALVSDPINLCIKGSVRVCNLDFHKSVHIRYSTDSWKSFSDLQAVYVLNSCDGFSDKFTFTLYCRTLRVGQRLEFAVRFQCKGNQYWDNNGGVNYSFQCLPASSPVGFIPIIATENTHDWAPMFY